MNVPQVNFPFAFGCIQWCDAPPLNTEFPVVPGAWPHPLAHPACGRGRPPHPGLLSGPRSRIRFSSPPPSGRGGGRRGGGEGGDRARSRPWVVAMCLMAVLSVAWSWLALTVLDDPVVIVSTRAVPSHRSTPAIPRIKFQPKIAIFFCPLDPFLDQSARKPTLIPLWIGPSPRRPRLLSSPHPFRRSYPLRPRSFPPRPTARARARRPPLPPHRRWGPPRPPPLNGSRSPGHPTPSSIFTPKDGTNCVVGTCAHMPTRQCPTR